MKNLFHSFHFRVTVAIVSSMVALSLLNSFLDYQVTFKSNFENERMTLKDLAKNAVLMVNAQQIKDIPLNKEGINSRSYQIVSQQLRKVQAANPLIEDIYVLAPTSKTNKWKFIVDLYAVAPDGTKRPGLKPGTDYDASRFSEMLNGLNEPSADRKLETDEYGTTLSGYAPIRDEVGKPVAVLGMDINANNIYAMNQKILKGSLIFLMIAIIAAVLLGAFISNRVVRPVKKLKDGVDYIKNGHWAQTVDVPGQDEIGQLAASFNEMAKSLDHYRQLLRRYFLDAAKSMTVILEAKDQYTLGHSQAVVNYSEKIALRLGIEPKLIENFKIVTLLHDIGKVGIKDSILQKPGKLDPEEFEKMKQHPLLGEQILKPILDDPLMRSVVRHHHERQDGRGYPDGLNEDQLPLLVSIVTVADSYDAMTSDRAYRKAMSKEEAIDQLVKNKGTQFHPKVVDAFLEILKEEGPSPAP